MTILVTLAAVVASCESEETSLSTDARAADEEAIRQEDLAWARTAQAGDLDALVSYYAEDVVLLPPNAPPVVGREAAREANRSMLAMPGYSVSWGPDTVEVAQSGDIGYARGSYKLSFIGPDSAPVNDEGKYVEIWRKQPDGAWKVAVEVLNSNLPARTNELLLSAGQP